MRIALNFTRISLNENWKRVKHPLMNVLRNWVEVGLQKLPPPEPLLELGSGFVEIPIERVEITDVGEGFRMVPPYRRLRDRAEPGDEHRELAKAGNRGAEDAGRSVASSSSSSHAPLSDGTPFGSSFWGLEAATGMVAGGGCACSMRFSCFLASCSCSVT